MVPRFPFFLLLLTCVVALAMGDGPLQDFCVAEENSSVRVNGRTCKDPKLVQADDFFYSGMNIVADTSNVNGHNTTHVFVDELSGLNTLGISVARNDFKPGGFNPPHTHPRASEVILVIEGTLEVGFVTSNPENRFITKIVRKGDIFVVPHGLLHFSHNIGDCDAVTIATFNSENPGVITATTALFGTKPAIASDLLAKSFQLNENIIVDIQSKFQIS